MERMDRDRLLQDKGIREKSTSADPPTLATTSELYFQSVRCTGTYVRTPCEIGKNSTEIKEGGSQLCLRHHFAEAQYTMSSSLSQFVGSPPGTPPGAPAQAVWPLPTSWYSAESFLSHCTTTSYKERRTLVHDEERNFPFCCVKEKPVGRQGNGVGLAQLCELQALSHAEPLVPSICFKAPAQAQKAATCRVGTKTSCGI